MSITAYTTYDDVRAVLGVSAKDLSDETLSLAWYSDVLDEELDKVSSTLAQAFSTASSETTPSVAQQRLMRSVRIFASVAVANSATAALRMFAPQQVTDGKAAMTRFSDPVKELAKEIATKLQSARDAVAAALVAVETTSLTSTPRVWFSVVSPTSDPVTG